MAENYKSVDLDEDLANPEWEKAGRVHDWRNHVGEETQKLWATFTPEQKRALAKDAQELADGEKWE